MADGDDVNFARTAGTPNSEEGMENAVKTVLDDELFAEFVLKSRQAGGRSRVLRDLICMWVNGMTYDEHVAKRRREAFFGPGQVMGQSAKAGR
jgi:hypothetical protein